MFKIDGKQNIYISQGDSAICDISIVSPNFPYNSYEMAAGDKLVFTVRSSPKQLNSEELPLIQKTLTEPCLILEPNDTANIEFGEYYYDVKLLFADGNVNTIIPSVTGKHYNTIADLPTFNICEVV